MTSVRRWGWLLVGVLVACHSEFDAGFDVTNSNGVPLDARPVAPPSFACDSWRQGAVVAQPGAALDRLAVLLWPAAVDAVSEARTRYGSVTSGAASGDFGCIARDMLGSHRAVAGVGRFYAWWLELDQPFPMKDPQLHPGYGPDRLALLARDAIDGAVNATLSGNGGYARLLTDPRPLVTSPAWGAGEPEPARFSAGLLGDPAVLARTGTAWATPWVRGWWLRQKLFCEALPPEPGELRETLPGDPDPNASLRVRYERTVASSNCAACHARFDPIGFALDAFDAVGRLRSVDREGHPYDLSGVLRAGLADPDISFGQPSALAFGLSQSSRVARCYARRWMEYLSGGAVAPDVDDLAVARAGDVLRSTASDPALAIARAAAVVAEAGAFAPR